MTDNNFMELGKALEIVHAFASAAHETTEVKLQSPHMSTALNVVEDFIANNCEEEERPEENPVVSTRCEDYPCCGHGPVSQGGDGGGCPVTYADGTQRWRCATCGCLMKVGAPSAICDECMKENLDIDYP